MSWLIPQPIAFVNNGAAMTVANLLANFPAGLSNAGLYARVSDLYNNGVAGGGVDEIVRCRYDAVNSVYCWMPQREAYNGIAANSSGSIVLLSLVTPPTIRMTATLIGNVTISASALNAYVGQRFNVINNSVVGLFTTTITGLIGSNIVLAGGSTQRIEYGSTGWFSS